MQLRLEASRLSSYSAPAQSPWGVWSLPQPGIKPSSPALAGGFFNHSATREAPFKSFNFSHSGASGVTFYCGLNFFPLMATYIILIDHLDTFVCMWIAYSIFYIFWIQVSCQIYGLPRWLSGKELACDADTGDLGSISGLGRSPGDRNGNPLQYSCLENPMDGGAWWATVQGLGEKCQTQLKRLGMYTHTHTHTHIFFFSRWLAFYFPNGFFWWTEVLDFNETFLLVFI